MNTLSSNNMTSPFGKVEECGKFLIDDTTTPFVFHDILNTNQEYTLSLWVKSDTTSLMTIQSKQFEITASWVKHVFTFTSTSVNMIFKFVNNGTYYIYHPKLEVGNVATDWSQSPDDMASSEEVEDAKSAADEASKSVSDVNERVNYAESQIQVLADSIAMLVTDENGASLMTQTENGWTFSMGETSSAVNDLSQKLNDLEQSTGDTQTTVDSLQQAVNDIGETMEYVRITVYEDEPCIELGESDSDYALMITNTRIMFRVGSSVPTLITHDGLVTDNIEVKHEFRHGNYVWMQRNNGHYSLQWKAVSE